VKSVTPKLGGLSCVASRATCSMRSRGGFAVAQRAATRANSGPATITVGIAR
jgi:hypothetical protein